MAKINISYNRKSTEDKGRQAQSIEDQRNVNNTTAQRWNMIIDQEFIDEKTALKPYVRENFIRMTELINDDKVANLFCWKLDRLARNPIEAGIITYMLQMRKIESIITHDKVFKPEDNALMTAVEFGMANQYSRDLGKNVKRGLESKKNKGWMPNLAPNGYLNERINQKGFNRILPDPERFKAIQKLWKLGLEGNHSIANLVDVINNTYKVKTKRGREFSKSTLHRIFQNPFYYGYFKDGETLIKGKHEPMVTKKEYDELQEIFNAHRGRPKGSKAVNKYNGLIQCGECGYTVIPEPLKKKFIKSTGKVKTYKYWRCSHKSKKMKCTQKSIIEVDLEQEITKFLETIEIDNEYIEWGMKFVEKHLDDDVKERKNLQKQYKAELTETSDEIDSLVKLMIGKANKNRTLLNETEFEKQKLDLSIKRDEITELLESLNIRQDDVIQAVRDNLEFCILLMEKFNDGGIDEKRKILLEMGRTIKMKDKNLYITPEKPFRSIQKVKEFTNTYPKWVELNPSRYNRDKEAFTTVSQLWRRGQDSNLRYSLTRTYAFQAYPFDHSGTSPK